MPKGNLPAKDKSQRPFVSTCDFQKRSQGTLGPGCVVLVRLGPRVPLGWVRMGRPEGGFASGYPKGGLARVPWDRAGLQGTLRAGSDGAP